ncbi:MAG: DUF6891 domain-containing protein, partial [Planctomycetales bacterium]
EQLRDAILGELRLSRYDHPEILDLLQNVYLVGTCPEQEWDSFLRLAAEEIDRVAAELAEEMDHWPEETDCDRLDRVELALRERGILLWQVSPCCDTCTLGDLPDRIVAIDQRSPGFHDRVRGYAFFIDQNMTEMLAEGSQLTVYLGYGWISPDQQDVSAEEYDPQALAIAREVCECLHAEGLKAKWGGDLAKKIGVSLNWQRRTLLE